MHYKENGKETSIGLAHLVMLTHQPAVDEMVQVF